jgi:hypothetical protein
VVDKNVQQLIEELDLSNVLSADTYMHFHDVVLLEKQNKSNSFINRYIYLETNVQ